MVAPDTSTPFEAFDPDDPALVPAAEPNAPDMLEQKQSGVALHIALKTLPPEQVELIRLSFFDEASHSTIAARLGLPIGTVKSRIRLAFGRLRAALEAYAGIARQRHGGELAALLHQGEHVTHAERHLHGMLQHLLAEAVEAGDVRSDVPPAELAQYCLHALTAATALTSQAAVTRLVAVTLDGLRPVP